MNECIFKSLYNENSQLHFDVFQNVRTDVRK